MTLRTFRLIATPILLLGLLALLVWGAFWGWRNLTAPFPEPEPTPCVTHTTDVLVPSQVSVRVINGGQTVGLATRVGESMQAAGFQVIRVSNTEERIAGIIIRSGSNNVDAATLVASRFNSPQVENDARVDGTVDILVGSDYPGLAEAPLNEVPVTSGTICLAPSPSPTDVPPPVDAPSETAPQPTQS
ncbi:LytR C-terminal domain-containing protein [Arachnia propionica]|nr:LytR C-terminal domain-containing protein [Arachnia propionica]